MSRPDADAGSDLAALPAADRFYRLSALVRRQVAEVLGYPTPHAVEPDRAFVEFGFDSLSALDFRNRLEEATGLRLSPTLTYDHPTPEALAAHLAATFAPVPASLPAHPPVPGKPRPGDEPMPAADASDEEIFAFIDRELGLA